jgi:hypothetical protein
VDTFDEDLDDCEWKAMMLTERWADIVHLATQIEQERAAGTRIDTECALLLARSVLAASRPQVISQTLAVAAVRRDDPTWPADD